MTAQRDILLQVVEHLEDLGIPYMVVGSFASSYWGRPRFTHDADMVVEVSFEKAPVLAHALETQFYAPAFAIQEAAQEHSHFNIIHLEHAFKVDFWVKKDEEFARLSFARRRQVTMFERQVFISSAEDTILSKLQWYKTSPVLEQQLRDALEVYEIQQPNIDEAYLNHWSATLTVSDLLARIRAEAASLSAP